MPRKMKQSRKKAQNKNMTVTLKPKTEITVPPSIRRKAGFKVGDRIEFKVSGSTITILSKAATEDDEYTSAERRVIDRGIAQSEKEYREGRSYGPFTGKEAVAFLHEEVERKAIKRQLK